MSRIVQSRYPSSQNPRRYQRPNADVSTHVLRNTNNKRQTITPRKPLSRTNDNHEPQNRFKFKKPSLQIVWLLTCLIGFSLHSYFVTDTFLNYEVATETVIETPKDVRPPSTSVCFLLWNLLKNESFPPDHPCRRNLKKKAAIENCVEELIKSPLKEILAMTYSPLEYLEFFELREVSNAWSTYKVRDKGTIADKSGFQEYYNGPYRCIRFETRNRDLANKLSVSNLTKGYPKARYFLNAGFDISPNITPHIMTVRAYVHETDTFPRGAITLPAILNVTKKQLFIVSYRRVETIYLPKPFKFNCVDYSGIRKLESREHCVDECMTKNDKTAVIENLHRDCNLTTNSDSKEEDFCHETCPVDCTTRTYYTMLADSTDEEETLAIITRFQEPETFVRYTPKLDLQAFIIYEAGILGLWFGVCIYFTLKDLYVAVVSVVKVVFKH